MQTLPANEERQRFSLLWGFVLSVLVHLLLILLTQWFPLASSPGQPLVEPDPSITFSFAQPRDPNTDDPEQDAPFLPVEPQPAPEVPPSPEIELDLPPVEPQPDPFEEPAEPSQPETSETIEEPVAASEFPVDEAGTVPRDDALDPAPAAQPQLDVTQALRDFRRAMAQQPMRQEPVPQTEGVKQNVISPDLSQIPYSGFGVGNLVFESRDYDWSDYGRQVYNAIWQAWHRRLWATTDEFEKWAHKNTNWYLDHRTQVRFVIERNGQVTGILQEAGSGCGPLDASAVDALTEVILPPLPAGFPRDREVVHAGFLATGQIRAMRRSLGALKAAGFF